ADVRIEFLAFIMNFIASSVTYRAATFSTVAPMPCRTIAEVHRRSCYVSKVPIADVSRCSNIPRTDARFIRSPRRSRRAASPAHRGRAPRFACVLVLRPRLGRSSGSNSAARILPAKSDGVILRSDDNSGHGIKIMRLDPIPIAVPYEHGGPKPMRPLGPWTHMETLFVRIDTDAGLIGWGEAFGFAASPLTREALSRMVAPLCVGREVADVPSFMTDLQRKLHAMGRHGPVSFALAGIEIALWDLVGKARSVPLHRLLGGASRDRIPTYASLLRYGNPDLVGRFTQEAVGQGYTPVKLPRPPVQTLA